MMDKPKKIYEKNEFIKFYLSEFNKQSMCSFCKYNPSNYKDMGDTLKRLNRANKCVNCEHLPQNMMKREHITKKRTLLNNFKPLYGWENTNE